MIGRGELVFAFFSGLALISWILVGWWVESVMCVLTMRGW